MTSPFRSTGSAEDLLGGRGERAAGERDGALPKLPLPLDQQSAPASRMVLPVNAASLVVLQVDQQLAPATTRSPVPAMGPLKLLLPVPVFVLAARWSLGRPRHRRPRPFRA